MMTLQGRAAGAVVPPVPAESSSQWVWVVIGLAGGGLCAALTLVFRASRRQRHDIRLAAAFRLEAQAAAAIGEKERGEWERRNSALTESLKQMHRVQDDFIAALSAANELVLKSQTSYLAKEECIAAEANELILPLNSIIESRKLLQEMSLEKDPARYAEAALSNAAQSQDVLNNALYGGHLEDVDRGNSELRKP